MNEQSSSAQAQEARITFVQTSPRSGRLVCCTVGGQYLGTVEYDAASPEALQILSAGFQQYAAQKSGGIQIASAQQVPGLRAA